MDVSGIWPKFDSYLVNGVGTLDHSQLDHGLVFSHGDLGIHHCKKAPYMPWSKQPGCFYKRGSSTWSSVLKHGHENRYPSLWDGCTHQWGQWGQWGCPKTGGILKTAVWIGQLMINRGMWRPEIFQTHIVKGKYAKFSFKLVNYCIARIFPPRNQLYLVSTMGHTHCFVERKQRESWWSTFSDFGAYTTRFIDTTCIYR